MMMIVCVCVCVRVRVGDRLHDLCLERSCIISALSSPSARVRSTELVTELITCDPARGEELYQTLTPRELSYDVLI